MYINIFIFASVPLLCFSLPDRCIFWLLFLDFIMTVTTVERSVTSVFHGLEMGEAWGLDTLLISNSSHVWVETAVKIIVISKELCFKIWKKGLSRLQLEE